MIALTILTGPARAQEMMVLTEDSPPFNFLRDNSLTGSSVEIVLEILRRIEHPDNIRALPWARGYNMLQTRANVALFSTARTPEREEQFYWIGPLYTVHFGFYARKDSNIKLYSLEDAKRVGSIATYKDDVREQLLKSMGFKNLDSSKSPASNLRKLMAGRVDLWLFSNLGMPGLAGQMGIDPSELKLILPFRSVQSYVAISRQTPEQLVNRWESAFQSMVQDGTFSEISRRWLPVKSIPDFKTTAHHSVGQPVIKLFTEDSPPGNYLRDGRPTGFAVDIVRSILQRLKQPDTITVVPWSRGYTLAQNSANVGLFSTTRLEQREKMFHWVGPLYTQTWAF